MEDSALQDSQALLLHSQLGRAFRLFSEVLGITALEACPPFMGVSDQAIPTAPKGTQTRTPSTWSWQATR